MKKIIVFVTALFFSVNSIYSQNYTSKDVNIFTELNTRVKTDNSFIDYDDVQGSPYLNDKFLEGKVYRNDSILSNTVSLRYNIFDDQIEVKDPSIEKNDGYGTLLKTYEISAEILFEQYKYYRNFRNPSSNAVGSYLQVIKEGKSYTLLKKHEVVFNPKEPYKSPYDTGKDAEFKKNQYYYVLDSENNFTELPDRKSRLSKIFNEKGKKLKSFVSRNNINLKEEEGILRVFSYLDNI
ncbi:hypothetical protein INR76_02485 [Marixanthomonas sp. SCSIO 43207]|uniref:hypothetical protein n=1 Tax=Marixanthomonas sp. SCSIO 43207 TaxID=2779360 RepID=UPI001CA80C30|nr:hypothetical protein [Marixanthomonas sp. SCSIO 43207]UAB81646.1 hypothetical protein INR76_02485 [Marixanthomonas sp. SCSIO 43207]